MCNVAFRISNDEHEHEGVIAPPTLILLPFAEEKNRGSSLLWIVGVLVLIQILDGVFTALGVAHLGVEAEGNPLLRSAMHTFGYIPTLVAAKSLSVGIVFALWAFASKVLWVEKAMALVAALYMVAAIIPWSIILTQKLVLGS